MPISRKSCALKAGIRARSAPPIPPILTTVVFCSLLSPLCLCFIVNRRRQSERYQGSVGIPRDRFCVSTERKNTVGERKNPSTFCESIVKARIPRMYTILINSIESRETPFAFLYALIYFVDVSSINYEKMTERECFHGQPFASMT